MSWVKKMINNILNIGKKREYKIQEINNTYILFKKLNEYKNKNDIVKDMSDLITDKKTEFEVIKKKE